MPVAFLCRGDVLRTVKCPKSVDVGAVSPPALCPICHIDAELCKHSPEPPGASVGQ